VTAMGAFVILHRLRQFAPVAKLMPALMLGLCFTVPEDFAAEKHHPHQVGPALQRLEPFRGLIASSDTRFVMGESAWEASYYLRAGERKIQAYTLLDDWDGHTQLESFLEERGVNLFYLDEMLIDRLASKGAAAGVF